MDILSDGTVRDAMEAATGAISNLAEVTKAKSSKAISSMMKSQTHLVEQAERLQKMQQSSLQSLIKLENSLSSDVDIAVIKAAMQELKELRVKDEYIKNIEKATAMAGLKKCFPTKRRFREDAGSESSAKRNSTGISTSNLGGTLSLGESPVVDSQHQFSDANVSTAQLTSNSGENPEETSSLDSPVTSTFLFVADDNSLQMLRFENVNLSTTPMESTSASSATATNPLID